MADVQLTCITKSTPYGGHERITHAGNASGTWPVELIIHNIDRGIDTFYVVDPLLRRRADVGVVREPGKRPYIRTYADGYYNNNLLSLGACPWPRAA